MDSLPHKQTLLPLLSSPTSSWLLYLVAQFISSIDNGRSTCFPALIISLSHSKPEAHPLSSLAIQRSWQLKKKKVFKKKIQAHSSSPPGLLCYHQHLLMWLLHNHELSNCHHPVSTLLNCCNYREKGNCATGCIKAQCALSTWRAHVYFDSFNLITGKEYNQLWLNVKDSCSTTQSSDCSLSVL